MRRLSIPLAFLPGLAAFAAALACSKSTEPPQGLIEKTQPPAAAAPSAAGPTSPTPALARPVEPSASAGESNRVTLPEGLSFVTPTAWLSVTPKSTMRRAEYRIPPLEDDKEEGELVVFLFGPGQGGTIEANVDRWFKQFEAAGGRPAQGEKHEKREVNTLRVTVVETAGRYVESMMQPAPRENWRLYGIIAETPKGNFFLKATGPDKTMLASRGALEALVSSLECP